MDEKLKAKLEKHRINRSKILSVGEKKDEELQAKLEKHRINRVKILSVDNKKLAMLNEAKELDSLLVVVENILISSEQRGLNAPDIKELVRVVKRLRSAAIIRWSVLGNLSNIDVSEAFNISSVRIAQIRKQVLGPKKDRSSS